MKPSGLRCEYAMVKQIKKILKDFAGEDVRQSHSPRVSLAIYKVQFIILSTFKAHVLLTFPSRSLGNDFWCIMCLFLYTLTDILYQEQFYLSCIGL